MGTVKLLKTREDVQEFYREVSGIIEGNPINMCIAEHAYDLISEADLVKKIMTCGSSAQNGVTLEQIQEAISFLRDECILNKGMILESEDWHYEISTFTKAVVDRLKKIKAEYKVEVSKK